MAFLKDASLGHTARQYILAMSLVNLALFVFQAYFIFYLQQSGLSYLQMSIIYSVNLVFCAILGLPMGNLADRYGRKRAFAAGIAVMGFAMLIYAFTHDFNSFLIAEVFWAFGWALTNGSNEAWVYDQLAREGRVAEGPRTFTAMMSLSYVLGVVGGVIASLLAIFSLNMPFLGAAIISFACVALVWVRLSENYGSKRVDLRSILVDSLSFYKRNRGLQLLTAAETFRYITGVIYLFLYQPYLVAIGLGRDMLGIYFSLLMLSSALGAFLAPRLEERVGYHMVMVFSSLGLIIGFTLLAITPGLLISCALFALCGLSYGLGWPSLMVWRNRIVPTRIRASALATFASFTYLAGAVITLTLGAVLDSTSPIMGFVFAALIGLASVPLYLLAFKQAPGNESGMPSHEMGEGNGIQQI